MVSVDDLVRRSKEGTVRPDELAEVAAILAADAGGESTYSLLYVLARSSATRYEDLVVSFLNYRKDTMVARLALQTLTSFWGYADRYTAELERFLDGVAWDAMGEVRQIAISASGRYLAIAEHCGLFGRLIAMAEREPVTATGGDDDEDDAVYDSEVERRVVLEALADALGEPARTAVKDPDGLRDRARRRYATACGPGHR